MLSNIHIENIAVIKCIDIDLSGGFCALTGETGAGKTVIMDAVKLLVGAKTDRELIRRGEDRAQVTGLFSDIPESTEQKLIELGYECEDRELLVSRTVSADGRSSIKLNGKSATSAILKSVVCTLLDFHGQHDNVTLLDSRTHMRMLDEYADNAAALGIYREKYHVYTEAKKALAAHLEAGKSKERELDYLLSGIREIESVKPKDGEEEKLEAERIRLANIEKITKQAGFVYKALYGGERGNACMLVDRSVSALSSVSDAVGEFEQLAQRLQNVYYELSDIAQTVEELSGTGGEDPSVMLDRIETRLDAIRKLKKKYGSDIAEILSYLDQAKEKVAQYENSEQIEKDLKKEYKRAHSELSEAAEVLSESRRNAAAVLCGQVAEVLSFLDMPRVRFEACVEPLGQKEGARGAAFSPDGADSVVFMIAMSASEPLLELSNVSGGEIARVMLALKSVICEKFGAQTVIYDEIDAGVSGKTARKIGIKLRESAASCQVICVTHSAQIASLSDVHYKICKETSGDRYESRIIELDRDGRVEELSRILGGINVTDAQRQAALDMLDGEE